MTRKRALYLQRLKLYCDKRCWKTIDTREDTENGLFNHRQMVVKETATVMLKEKH